MRATTLTDIVAYIDRCCGQVEMVRSEEEIRDFLYNEVDNLYVDDYDDTSTPLGKAIQEMFGTNWIW